MAAKATLETSINFEYKCWDREIFCVETGILAGDYNKTMEMHLEFNIIEKYKDPNGMGNIKLKAIALENN